MAATDWSDRLSPSLADIERLGQEAYRRLPELFRRNCEGLIIRVTDFPDDETLDAMGCESDFDLLGLFSGVGLAQLPAVAPTGHLPNIIHLYRRPLIDYWASHEETLGHLVAHVLIHEIGHHLGFSDADMEAIEAQAR
ncbi:Predicted Zn-dependent protease, minimal metalloprotease (MMP)-like domain [Rhizobiales bacterium GAS191]|jgi:predicted Zn-dependent protease with MMP-like domain|nr:Predicted Zn-dependent protease, minimal metalloprotease (MMP)-like domain [Rhizobiales bacterium GAS113]SEC52955.1 Predicted Zn-dependent protease, minimal metalloprotease (MMP)-like domain [Rhizobiales bacterium GAS191]